LDVEELSVIATKVGCTLVLLVALVVCYEQSERNPGLFSTELTNAAEDDHELLLILLLLDGSDQELEDHVSAGGCHDSDVGAGSTQLEDVHSGGAEEDSQADVEVAVSDHEVVLDSTDMDVLDSVAVDVLEVVCDDDCEEVLVMALATPVGRTERLDDVVSAGCIDVPPEVVVVAVGSVNVGISDCCIELVWLAVVCRLEDVFGTAGSPGTIVTGNGGVASETPTWGDRR
jgi:hypothetical protein